MLEGPGITALLDRTFDGYRVARFLEGGRGGARFAAVDEPTGRPVDVHVFHPYFAGDVDFARRLERVGGALLTVRHPNLVPVLAVGADAPLGFLVSAAADETTLAARLARSSAADLAARTALAVMILPQIGNALQALHAAGIVHGGLAPSAIRLSPAGRARLAGAGIAAIAVGDQVAGVDIGTPEYLAPEQAQVDEPPGPAADQYALAVIAYEMLVGQAPFRAPTPAALMRLHRDEPVPPPSRLAAGLPPALDAVLLRALAKTPADRYPDVDAFLAGLLLALADVTAGPAARPVAATPPEPARPLVSAAPAATPPVTAAPPATPLPAAAPDRAVAAPPTPAAAAPQPAPAPPAPPAAAAPPAMPAPEAAPALAPTPAVTSAPAPPADAAGSPPPSPPTAPPAAASPPASPGDPGEPAADQPAARVRRYRIQREDGETDEEAAAPAGETAPSSPTPANSDDPDGQSRVVRYRVQEDETAHPVRPATPQSAPRRRRSSGLVSAASMLLTLLIIVITALAMYLLLAGGLPIG